MTAHTGIEHEQEPFTMTITLPAFLDALDKRMNDWMQKFGVGEPAPMLALQNMIRGARDDIDQQPATQPDPVPELPEWMRHEKGGEWAIKEIDGYETYYRFPVDPDDLIRISEAARILAARERARRAGR